MPWVSNHTKQAPTWKNLNWSLCMCSKLLNSFDIKLLTSEVCRILYLGKYLDDRRSCVSFLDCQHYFTMWIISVCKAVMKICKSRHTVLLTLCLLWWKKLYLTHTSKNWLPQANRILTNLFSFSAFKKNRHSEKSSVTFLFRSFYVNLSWVNPGTHWICGYNLSWTGRKGLDVPI